MAPAGIPLGFLELADAVGLCEWAPIISARLGGIHTPITNILLANSITSRPTILPQGYRIALHTPTAFERQYSD